MILVNICLIFELIPIVCSHFLVLKYNLWGNVSIVYNDEILRSKVKRNIFNIFWRIFTILLLIIENFCTSPHDTCTITPGVVCFKNRLGHVLLLNPGCQRTRCWDFGNLCPNLMKLSRVSNPPKTGFNRAPA